MRINKTRLNKKVNTNQVVPNSLVFCDLALPDHGFTTTLPAASCAPCASQKDKPADAASFGKAVHDLHNVLLASRHQFTVSTHFNLMGEAPKKNKKHKRGWHGVHLKHPS